MGEAKEVGWEYAVRGDYHRNLDLNWSYAPTYLRKMAHVRARLAQLPAGARVVDVGCGEGVLIDELRPTGLDITGIDLNYEAPFVERGSALDIPMPSQSCDAVLLLDVLEHIAFVDQPAALREIRRVLRADGLFLVSVPNLAHLSSRVRFALRGGLHRTDLETNHVGERPYVENKKLLTDAGFWIERETGITLTVPWIYKRLISRHARRLRWLHDLLEPFAHPALAMIDIFECRPAP